MKMASRLRRAAFNLAAPRCAVSQRFAIHMNYDLLAIAADERLVPVAEPRLGEQTREVLEELLSLTPAEYDRLAQTGAVFPPDSRADPAEAHSAR